VEVWAEKKGPRKKKPKVNNQKKLTRVLCWLTKGQEGDEKGKPSYGLNGQLV
jgi:hypothetical protein